MFVALWEFDVKPGSVRSFANVYGPDGDWANLFRQASGFQRTILLKDANRAYRYWTCDIWKSRKDYEDFLRTRTTEYEDLDKKCKNFTQAERRIGIFEEA
ncbi:MAG TPA: hypothetical protein VJN93_09345 [Candidatus Acidoferrum sp.]|nr:hypothetical protein [Candidatus Acidoferrum sp.]